MKVFNGFCGVGGNRKSAPRHFNFTSMDIDPTILGAYSELFPCDTIIEGNVWFAITDLDFLNSFDLVWLSPPCQSHSRMQHNALPELPDFRLWSLMPFLNRYFKGLYVVENVIPFYKPIIKPSAMIGRHLFWSNFNIPSSGINKSLNLGKTGTIESLEKMKIEYDLNFSGTIYYDGNHNPCQVLNNAVHPDIARKVWDSVPVALKLFENTIGGTTTPLL